MKLDYRFVLSPVARVLAAKRLWIGFENQRYRVNIRVRILCTLKTFLLPHKEMI